MREHRVVNLKLLSLRFPLTALVSIAHRLSGLLLIFFIPSLLWVLRESLSSETAFKNLQVHFENPVWQMGIWLFLSALAYHLMAGIRHLLMDIRIGDSLRAARLSARMVMIFGVLLAIAGGIWIWWK